MRSLACWRIGPSCDGYNLITIVASVTGATMSPARFSPSRSPLSVTIITIFIVITSIHTIITVVIIRIIIIIVAIVTIIIIITVITIVVSPHHCTDRHVFLFAVFSTISRKLSAIDECLSTQTILVMIPALKRPNSNPCIS